MEEQAEKAPRGERLQAPGISRETKLDVDPEPLTLVLPENLGHMEQRRFQPEGIKKREDTPLSRGCSCTPNPSFEQGKRQGTSWGVHRAGPLDPQAGTGLGTPGLASSCRGHKTLLVLNLWRRGMCRSSSLLPLDSRKASAGQGTGQGLNLI